MSSFSIKCIISIVAAVLVLVHQFTPVKIDLATGFLLLLIILPWLKSLVCYLEMPERWKIELPGGWKFEYAQKLARVTEDAEAAGIKPKEPIQGKKDYSFLSIADQDQRLALAGLRIELEQLVNELLEHFGDEKERSEPLSRKFKLLNEYGVINHLEMLVLEETASILNQAVHGRKIDEALYKRSLDLGLGILNTLENKLKTNKEFNEFTEKTLK